MSKYLKKVKGDIYENFVLDHILNNKLYDQAWLCKYTPDYIFTKIGFNINEHEFNTIKHDIGTDIIAIKDDILYFIQCKNFEDTVYLDHLAGILYICYEYNINGIVYYNGRLSNRFNILSNNKLKFINLSYDNSHINDEYSPKQILNNISNTIFNYTLRDYQIDAINYCSNKDRAIISLPCGMGKTLTSYNISSKYDNIIIIAPYRDLVNQNLEKYNLYSNNSFNNILISCDGSRNEELIISNLKDKNLIGVTYKSVDILNKILNKLNNKIIIIDEYHNLNDNLEEQNILLESKNKILFLSATPPKNNNKEIYGDTVYSYSWNKAIEKGYINDFDIHIPDDNDYNINYKNDIDIKENKLNIDEKEILEELNTLYPKLCFCLKGLIDNKNEKCIIYVSNINKAILSVLILDKLSKIYGIDIDIYKIDHQVNRNNKEEILNSFRKSKNLSIMINVHILDEGIDIIECDSIFISDPSDNMSNLIQRISRCNRKKENKSDVYIWDNKDRIEKIIKYLDENSNDEFSKKIINKNSILNEKNNNIPNNILLDDIEYNKKENIIENNDFDIEINKIIDESLEGNTCNTYDIARILHYKYKDIYIYNIEDKKWYYKIDNKWIENDDLFLYISTKIVELYKNKKNMLNSLNKIKKIDKYINNIKLIPFKKNIITECKNFFKNNILLITNDIVDDETIFLKKINNNTELLFMSQNTEASTTHLHTKNIYNKYITWFKDNYPNKTLISSKQFFMNIKQKYKVYNSVRVNGIKSISSGIKNIKFIDNEI